MRRCRCNAWMGWTASLSAVCLLLLAASELVASEGAPSERLLVRRKRYLIFPEGSSFQLVYDQIIPIVDYTNLFIFGVTTALAWPLPDKPIDDAKLREMYTNGTLLPFRRIDDTDDSSTDSPAAASLDAADELNSIGPMTADRRPDGYYYSDQRRPANGAQINQLYAADDVYYSAKHGGNYEQRLSNDIDRLAQLGAQRPWPTSARWSKKPYAVRPSRPTAAVAHRRHMIYPALGKRSVREAPAAERWSVHHHRATRHALYASIERYLQAHDQHGGECVRRALCETSQRARRDAQPPGSFVGELLRVVFSLPDVAEAATDHERMRREDGYDEAYHGVRQAESCAERYARCAWSIWESVYTL